MSDSTETTKDTPKAPHPGYTFVKSGLTGADKDKVALSEWDPAHPENAEGRTEVWVAGAQSAPVKVAKTPEVVRHIREGELIEVPASDAAEHQAAFAAEMREREKRQLESRPEFATLAAGLRARGLSIHELMTGEPTAAVDGKPAEKPLTKAERKELDELRAQQASAPPSLTEEERAELDELRAKLAAAESTPDQSGAGEQK